MERILRILLVVCCFGKLVSGGGWELPSYLPKCSITDPKLNDCFKENANIAIPFIARGDPEFGIPSLSPLKLPIAEIKPINANFYDVYTDDIKNIRITKASLDFKNGKIAFSAYTDKIEGLVGNYSFISGKVLGIPVFGHGKANITIKGISINFKGDMELYEKDGDTYMKFVNTTVETDVKRAHYSFENLQSAEKSDINKYIDDNWRTLQEMLKPSTDYFMNQFVNSPITAIFSKVPLKKIFLP